MPIKKLKNVIVPTCHKVWVHKKLKKAIKLNQVLKFCLGSKLYCKLNPEQLGTQTLNLAFQELSSTTAKQTC